MGKCKDCRSYNPKKHLSWIQQVDIDRKEAFFAEAIQTGHCAKLKRLTFHLEKSNGIYPQYPKEKFFVGRNFGCIHFGRRK